MNYKKYYIAAISVLYLMAAASNLLDAQEFSDSRLAIATYNYLDDGTLLSVSTPSGDGHVYRGNFVYSQDGSTLEYVILDDGTFQRVREDSQQSEGNGADPDSNAGNEPSFRSLWFVKDQVGSVVSVIDITDSDASADDAVVMKTGYLPFGSERQNANFVSDASMRYRFNGKETQPWTAGSSAPGTLSSLPHLLDYGARSYDPLTCSWTTPDPLANKYLSWSPYTFCAGNPVNFVDPDGMNWYSYTDGEGHQEYKYSENKLTEEEILSGGYTDLGYTYVDKNTELYYSLFGNIVALKDSNDNKRLEGLLYQHIDNLLINSYSGDSEGYGRENFFTGISSGEYGFSYCGKSFKSMVGYNGGTIFRAVNNQQNSILHIRQMPPKSQRRFGGYNNAPSWFGCFLILSNDKNFDAVQINFNEENSQKFNHAVYNLFLKRK